MITPYLSILDATTILDQYLNMDAFASATATEQTKALNSATMAIDNLFYSGTKTSDTQTNEFPRDDEVVVPDAILEACAIEANTLLDGKDTEVEWENEWMQSQTYAGVNSKYNRNSNQPNIISGIMSVISWRLLQPYFEDYRKITVEKN